MLTLRPYQHEALEAIAKARTAGKLRVILSLPTGGGKTIVFAHQVAEAAQHGRVLILVHRDELVHQTLDKLHQLAPDLQVGIVKADRTEVEAPIVLASVQTLARATRLDQLAQHWQLIIVDECHHVDGELSPSEGPPTAAGVLPAPCLVGNSWVRTLQHCGAWDASFTVGCSATPYRPNGTSIIGPIFEETVYHKHLLWMMLAGYLSGLVVKRLHVAGMDLKRVRTVAGDYRADALEAAMFKANAPAQIVSGIQQYAHDRRLAVFSPGIAHAEAITALCQARGVTAQTIMGSTPWETWQAAYEAVSAGTCQVLSSVMVLTEGFDLPAIDAIVLARATKSKVLFAQALGRGLRLSPETGKGNCLLLDATGATERHNLFSVAELLGLSAAMLSEEQSVLEAVAALDVLAR
jgi:superfamily II DNA or RNA helicase